MAEPTSALTFGDLILEFAIRAGTAYYGAAGDSAPAVPIDAHDLAEAKRHVNNAFRMFISDAPLQGWRWTRPTAQLVIWPDVELNVAVTVTGVHLAGLTTVTATAASFYPSMEGKSIVITGVGTFTIATYTSSTVIVVTGNATAVAATFSIASEGNFTLPQTFGGSVNGGITYAAGTNRSVPISWSNETIIRQRRENVQVETGAPQLAAPRIRSNQRRWELMVYPTPDEVMTIEFPYDLYFDELTDVASLFPCPFLHDETLRAAVRAMVEKEIEDSPGTDWDYYSQKALPNSQQIDSRSAPRRLGYCGNPDLYSVTRDNFRDFRPRPNATFNP